MRPIFMLLAACGSSAPITARVPAAATPAPVESQTHTATPAASTKQPPEIFGELVQPHGSWKLPAEVVSIHDGRTTRTKGEVTCTTDATVVGEGWRVELACEGM